MTTTSDSDSAEKAEWLVWSHYHHSWWGPDMHGYTNDLWKAGRYTESVAKRRCLTRGGWPNHGQEKTPPPEVLVLAPESGHEFFTAAELATIQAVMRQRIDDATATRIAMEVGR